MKEYFSRTIKVLAETTLRGETMSAEMFTREAYEQYPKKFYKYKSLVGRKVKYVLEMISDEYLWADHPSSFDDISDSRINVTDGFNKQLQQWFNSHLAEIWFHELPPKGMKGKKGGHTLKDYREVQDKYIDAEGKVKKKELLEALPKMVHGLSQNELAVIRKAMKDNLLPDSNDFLIKGWENHRDDIVNAFQNNSLIACVTKTYKNRKMWEDYANGYSGIVIEYTLPEYDQLTDEQKVLLLHLFPVTYLKRIPKVSLTPIFEWSFQKRYWKKEINISDFWAELYEQILCKEPDYITEKEWRFIDCSKEQRIPMPFIRRVYAGYKISDKNLKKVMNVCRAKGFELYLQKENPAKREFQYIKQCL